MQCSAPSPASSTFPLARRGALLIRDRSEQAFVMVPVLQRTGSLYEHDAFPKSGSHFSGSCFERRRGASRCAAPGTGIGIGGNLTAPPLPHHRTYGSVYGGSMD